jgi:catechol 2,3-dioxygenase-like lactoylglutathione lyase family enzyme
MEPRISLITLGVADPGRSYWFYREGLGLPARKPEDGSVWQSFRFVRSRSVSVSVRGGCWLWS